MILFFFKPYSIIVNTSANDKGASIRAYFLKVQELHNSGNEFPVNLDDIFHLVYSEKGKAVRALKTNFLENEDFKVVAQNGKNLNGRPTIDYFLSVAAMDILSLKKLKQFLRFTDSFLTEIKPFTKY